VRLCGKPAISDLPYLLTLRARAGAARGAILIILHAIKNIDQGGNHTGVNASLHVFLRAWKPSAKKKPGGKPPGRSIDSIR
jgi:hypothetical protein